MIPEFPQFKPIDLSDRKDVEKITHRYPPYSDFNFVSLWSWDIKGDMRLSMLNENLVVLFTDYLTCEKFLSFLGNNKTNETAEALLDFSKKEGWKPRLRLVPEVAVKALDAEKFKIVEDRDHFDYIFSIENLFHYPGHEFQKHRNMVRRFEKKHSFEIKIINLTDTTDQNLLLGLVQSWVSKKKPAKKIVKADDCLAGEDVENELVAFQKLLSAPAEFLQPFICSGLFIDGNLSGFIINEKISKDYCLAHFGKADIKHEGIYHFLMRENAKVFFDLGINYLNHEQDLGFENLRFSKEAYHPTHFLKKYTVAL